jgi:hypothetical protein
MHLVAFGTYFYARCDATLTGRHSPKRGGIAIPYYIGL